MPPPPPPLLNRIKITFPFHNVAKFDNLRLLLNRCQSLCQRDLYVFVRSMFKDVASENVPLVLILQSYSQVFIIKYMD